jgi:hypothetical protein
MNYVLRLLRHLQANPYADEHPLTSMEIARVRLLLHDYQSSVASEVAAESPEPVVPPAGSGYYHFIEVEDLARTIYTSGRDSGLHSHQDVFEKSTTRHALRRTAQALLDAGYRRTSSRI